MQYSEIMSELRSHSDPRNVEGMKRFGISARNTLGVSVVALRKIASSAGKDHSLALRLWSSGIHEARILASIVDEPDKATSSQLDSWAKGFDSWDVCDQCCSNLFSHTRFAYAKVFKWGRSDSEFVKRAGFALIAAIAVHDKKMSDADVAKFLPLIKAGARDERNFVKKAVNWALRQVGKRDAKLNRLAIKAAEEISRMDSRSAKWIAADALRELRSGAVRRRLSSKR